MGASSPKGEARWPGAELAADLLSPRAIPALSAGATSGLGLLVAHVAYGSYVFSGPLADYTSQGVGLVLFANFAACLVIALAGGFRGAISGLPPALLLVMALIGSTMDAEGDALFVTVSAALMLGATATGAFCLLLGHFRFAGLVRFIPYPVAGGFVAGIGGAVCLAAMTLMGAEVSWRDVPALFEPQTLLRWAPGAGYGIVLYLATRRWRHPLILPVSVVLAVGAYHVALSVLGIGADEARQAGLLFTGTSEGRLWPPLAPADFALVDWAALGAQIPNLLTLMLVALVCIVMNLAGLELAANEELDWDREFRAHGLGSIAAGLGGAAVGSMIVPASLRSKLFGAATRLTGVVAALVVGAAVLLGDRMLELVPTSLVGGILFFAGLGMLDESLVRNRKRLPLTDYGIIVVIFVAIVGFGLLEGVGTGMLATLIFFAVRLSRVDPIESHFDARERRSKRARPVPDRTVLISEGDRGVACRLRGYLFFGSASALIDRLRALLASRSNPACLVLDFELTSGVDFSALNSLARFIQTTQGAGTRVVLSAVPEQLKGRLARNLPPDGFAELDFVPDVDRGLEHCEDAILAAWREDAGSDDRRRSLLLERSADDLERQLERQIGFEEMLERIDDLAELRDHDVGEALTSAPEDLQLLVSGRASVLGADGGRLAQLSAGDAVWSTEAGLGEGSLTVADDACRTAILTAAAQELLERRDAELAIRLYRHLLSGRLETPTEGQP